MGGWWVEGVPGTQTPGFYSQLCEGSGGCWVGGVRLGAQAPGFPHELQQGSQHQGAGQGVAGRLGSLAPVPGTVDREAEVGNAGELVPALEGH